METTEKLVPLTQKDIDSLKAEKSGRIGCLLLVLVTIAIATALLYFVMNDMIFSGRFNLYDGRITFTPGAFAIPIGVFLGVVALVMHKRRRGRTSKDIDVGMKKVVTAQVLKRFKGDLDPKRRTNFANTTAYMVGIGGMLYDVTEEEYQNYQEGMWVEVHSAPHSGEFLGIYDPRDGKLLTEMLYEPPEAM